MNIIFTTDNGILYVTSVDNKSNARIVENIHLIDDVDNPLSIKQSLNLAASELE